MRDEWRIIARQCNEMAVGLSLTFDGMLLPPTDFFSKMPGIERFKENLIGMNWGSFDVRQDLLTGRVTVTRLEIADKPRRVRHDWDRRELVHPADVDILECNVDMEEANDEDRRS